MKVATEELQKTVQSAAMEIQVEVKIVVGKVQVVKEVVKPGSHTVVQAAAEEIQVDEQLIPSFRYDKRHQDEDLMDH